jgi:tRNA (guanine26-N2/guanine27-N2)-dimethyltransferase
MNINEGVVELTVPAARDGADAGVGDDVFYNPTQELNRDITVAVLRAYQDRKSRTETYLDAMTASGVRGVRAAASGYDVTCTDIDPDAVALAQSNLERNGLDGQTLTSDANAVLHQSGPESPLGPESIFDIVDLDPFGTPIPFADAAFANTRNLVCVTATDTAPLCGAHQHSGIRTYSTLPQNTEYHPEMGLRVLLSALIRTAARYDTAAVPILSHVTRHYVRTYLELDTRATRADALLSELGYVHHCEDCLTRQHEFGHIAHPPSACQHCKSTRIITAGPLYLGSIREQAFTRRVRDHITTEMGKANKADSILEMVEGELETPTHYDQHRLCKKWTRSAIGMDEFIEQLQTAGFDATRTHYSGTAFKTDASVEEIRSATTDSDEI